MNLILATDLMLILLLAATIVYCFRLNKKLTSVRQDRILMNDLIQGFSAAISKAQLTVEALRQPTLKLVTDLTQRKEEGQACRDELIFLIERAEILASTLEQNISDTRQEAQHIQRTSQKTKQTSGGSPLAAEMTKVRGAGTTLSEEASASELKKPINKETGKTTDDWDKEISENLKVTPLSKTGSSPKGSHILSKVSQSLASEGKSLIESLRKLR